jgi:cell division protease FtsH
METILLSIILMSLVMWIVRFLTDSKLQLNNYHTFPATNDASIDNQKPISTSLKIKLLAKKLLIAGSVFLLCYAFVSIVNKYAQFNLLIKYSQNDRFNKQQQDSNSELAAANQEAINKKLTQGYFEILHPKQVKTLFKDIAGLYEAKEELTDLIQFLNNPLEFQRLGAKPPKGILLYGAPGTGKTMLARALAGEARVSFISTSGSQFEEEYVGVGAARIRELFKLAREQAPCVVFIDEIDSIAFKRHTKNNPAWSAQAVNQLLTEMDGLNDHINKGILIVAASNRIDALDNAILRPGRLDRHIKLDLPTQKERQEIFSIYLNKIVTNTNLDPEKLAKITPGFSSAELANLVNEAAIDATKNNKNNVDLESFEVAKDRFVLGSTRKASIISEKDKKITAYHEAGHALVGYFLPDHNPIYKVTIAPRGPSLGHTNFQPLQDVNTHSKTELENIIASSLGGRIAEELIFGKNYTTTGAENDLHTATKLAHNMVAKWGYSEKLGLIYSADQELDFISKETIESEVKLILHNAHKKANDLLTKNKEKLHKLAKALLEQETLDNQQVAEILGAKTS